MADAQQLQYVKVGDEWIGFPVGMPDAEITAAVAHLSDTAPTAREQSRRDPAGYLRETAGNVLPDLWEQGKNLVGGTAGALSTLAGATAEVGAATGSALRDVAGLTPYYPQATPNLETLAALPGALAEHYAGYLDPNERALRLREHPVGTALDLVPVGQGLKASQPVGRAMVSAAQKHPGILTGAAGAAAGYATGGLPGAITGATAGGVPRAARWAMDRFLRTPEPPVVPSPAPGPPLRAGGPVTMPGGGRPVPAPPPAPGIVVPAGPPPLTPAATRGPGPVAGAPPARVAQPAPGIVAPAPTPVSPPPPAPAAGPRGSRSKTAKHSENDLKVYANAIKGGLSEEEAVAEMLRQRAIRHAETYGTHKQAAEARRQAAGGKP